MNDQREKLNSRLGFILLSAGCAIGLGNVWTFPWRTGNNGGGAFVLLYVLAAVFIGLPVMFCEFSLGRASQASPVRMYQTLEKPGTKWHLHGYMALAANVFLMMFYTTVAGWFFYYFGAFVTGRGSTLDFAALMASPGINLTCLAIVVAVGFLVLSFNLQKGLESVSKVMMALLFVLLAVLVVRSCLLSGAKEGLTFYLKPDFSIITGQTVVAAMNQSFFSLSLGIGSMAIFGSYIGKERSLMGESGNIIFLDTLVALMAGFIIFPVCFTYGISPDAGPSLLFVTMTSLFNNMPAGSLWGALFFLFMIFAAMSTVLAVFENILACIRELTGWDRKKGCLICGIVMFLLCVPMALNFTGMSWFVPFAPGSSWMDFMSFLVETICQPIGSIIIVLFCCNCRKGWGWDNFLAEVNSGSGAKVPKWMRFYVAYIVPAIVGFVFLYGLFTFSWK